MSKHSSIVGGSTAARLLNCAGSYQAMLKLPPSADISSEYADEGTAMHEVMTYLMSARLALEMTNAAPLDQYDTAFKAIGTKFYDRLLTQEHLDTMVFPALDALADLEASYGDGFKIIAVEQSVIFPGIPGAHGTCDLILINEKIVLHVDWKFGQGVGVRASYSDAHGETVNAQLLFYAAGAINTIKGVYTGRRALVLAIIQPRGDEPLTHVMVSRKEIKWFIEDLQAAVVRALDYDPPRQKGEWCRFAPCKIDCPQWTGPMLELTALGKAPANNTPNDAVTPYGEYLAKSKSLVDLLSMFSKEVNEQLHAYLESGGLVPGWRLKDKVKNRQWIDDETVAKALSQLGFEFGEVFQTKLQTFRNVDATAKRRGVEIPDHLRVAPPTTETTVCQTDDPAPPVERRVAVEEFASSLRRLAK